MEDRHAEPVVPDLPVAAPDPAAIRERAEYAVSAEFADMLLDAPEDAPRWAAWLGADALALLAARQQDKERIERLETALATAALPLEVLRGQIAVKPYQELTAAFQQQIVEATDAIRAALAVEEDAHG